MIQHLFLFLCHLHAGVTLEPAPATGSLRDRGQATTEYALVMLGAAVIALLVIAWATAGGGAGKIGSLFDRVIDAVTGKI